MGRLRSARRRFERSRAFSPDRVVDVAALDQDLADEQGTLLINDWRFVGTGWTTSGDAVLVAPTAVIAREYADVRGAQSRNSTTKRLETERCKNH